MLGKTSGDESSYPADAANQGCVTFTSTVTMVAEHVAIAETVEVDFPSG